MYKKIIQNKRINHQYFILKKLEAGIILFGWEIKSIRSKNIEINNSYISINNNEAYLYNIVIQPLLTSSSHIQHNSLRTRKLLLKKKEIHLLFKKTKDTSNTIVLLELYWKNNWIKATIGIAKGKKKHDKRMETKKREWMLDKNRILKYN